MTMWEDVKRNLVDWYGVTSDKTREVAKVTSRRYDKFGISRDIERQLSELGNLVYLGLREKRENVLDDPAVTVLVERLDQLEQELQAKEEEIEEIREQHRQHQHAEGAATVETPDFEEAGFETAQVEDPLLVESLEVGDSEPGQGGLENPE